MSYKTYDLSKTAHWARGALAVYCLAELLLMASSASYIWYFRVSEGAHSTAELLDQINIVTVVLYFLMYLVCIVIVGMWIYRAASNAMQMANQPEMIRPGWAVGWYFIPFANLVLPFQAMRQIWNIHINPTALINSAAPRVLNLWWLGWIVMTISARISAQVLEPGTPDAFVNSGLIDLAGGAFGLLAAVCLRRIIQKVTEASALGVTEEFAEQVFGDGRVPSADA